MIRFFSLAVLLCCFFFCCSVVSAEDGTSANELNDVLVLLEDSMSDISSMQTKFVQEKKISMLQSSIHLEGLICIEKPMNFAWHVQKPLEYSFVVKDDVIRQWDGDSNSVQKISLDKNPVFKMVFLQMQGWITGQYVSMLDAYAIKKCSDTPLILEFVPRDTNMSFGLIDKVIVSYKADIRYIDSIAILESSGDESTLTFIDTIINEKIDSSVWEVSSRV